MPDSSCDVQPSRWPPILVSGLCLLVYALFAFPVPDWLDSPEFLAAAHRLGIFHPPASPLAVMAAHPLFAWPGPQADGLALLFSAICLSAAAGLFTRLLQTTGRIMGVARDWRGDLLAALLGLGLGLSAGPLGQALRCEVYGLACLLFVAGLHQLLPLFWLADGARSAEAFRRALRSSVLLGMGMAVHGPMVLALLGLLPLIWSRPGLAGLWWKPARLPLHALGFALGAAPLFLLPLMVGSPVDLRWGDPRVLADWFAIISGQAFAPSFTAELSQAGHALPRYLAVLLQSTGWVLFVLCLPGLYLLARHRWRLAAGLALCLLINSASLLLQRSFRLDNPDVTGYALPAAFCIGLLAGTGLMLAGRILERWKAKATWAVLALAALPLLGLTPGLHRASRAHCGAAVELAADSMRAMPAHGLVLCADFNLCFMLDYLQELRELRPDVEVLYLRDLDNQALLDTLPPELQRVLPGSGQLGPRELAALARRRPLALDAGPHLRPEVARHGRPVGLLWQLGQQKARDLDPEAAWACADGSRDQRGAEILAWHYHWQSRAARAIGQNRLARRLAGLARCAAPLDRDVQAMDGSPAGSCPPAPAPQGTVPQAPPAPWSSALGILLALALWAAGALGLGPVRAWALRAIFACSGLLGMALVTWLAA